MKQRRYVFPRLTDKKSDLLPSKWMYSTAYPAELFVVEGKWVRSLMQIGFRVLTIAKVYRNLERLWKDTLLVNRDDLCDHANEWLREGGHELVISKRRMDYVFQGDERAELNDLFVKAIAAALGVPAGQLYADKLEASGLGLYRCIVVVAEEIYQRAYVAVSAAAAAQRCLLDLLVGPERITSRPEDWYKATVECVELEAWQGSVSAEELAEWLGRIGMRFVGQKNTRQYSRISDMPP